MEKCHGRMEGCIECSNWELGNEKHISVWKDTWSSFKKPLLNLIHTPLNLGEENLTIDSLINNEKCDVSFIGYDLPKDIADTFLVTLILEKSTLRDKYRCFLTPEGRFSTGLTYHHILTKNFCSSKTISSNK